MAIYDLDQYRPLVILYGNDSFEDFNLQKDDIDKNYEFECMVKVKSITSYLENFETPRRQYVLELISINKFKEEV